MGAPLLYARFPSDAIYLIAFRLLLISRFDGVRINFAGGCGIGVAGALQLSASLYLLQSAGVALVCRKEWI